jgi:AAA domain (Cdc48 subfamily)/C-terminal, D2-small domain, of ClpB protein
MTVPAGGLDPAWLREIDASLGVSSQFVLSGNTADLVISQGEEGEAVTRSGVVDALWGRLRRSGFDFLVVYDLSEQLRIHPEEAKDGALAALGERADGELSHDRLTELIRKVSRLEMSELGNRRCALVVERAGRLVVKADALNPTEHKFFADVARAATISMPHLVDGARTMPLFNPVIWVVENERELPDWFLDLGERLRTAAIPHPEVDERERMARSLAPVFSDYDELGEDERENLVHRYASHTQGMTLADMQSIMRLAADRDLGLRDIEDAARGYRVGVLENPWKQTSLREKVKGEIAALDQPVEKRQDGTITQRVMGQDDAVRRSLDILARSVTNLTAAHRSAQSIGPTGVGKTELAKALTELVFGDSGAYTRFDMSEFAEEGSAARLIGAPPGYIGFNAGGELTNAIRERAFSLILFDEIEKAHSLILDKFLQILEDGRLTDGRGGTVVFTEAVLVFTSNLGVYRKTEDGRREQIIKPPPEMDRNEAEERVLDEIKRFFIEDLGRPELRNRFGNNIIVFDFIDREAGDRILSLLLKNVVHRIEREYRAKLVISPQVREQLAEIALADLSNGGRGIGTVVEQALVNPLARKLVGKAPGVGEQVTVASLRRDGALFELECE